MKAVTDWAARCTTGRGYDLFVQYEMIDDALNISRNLNPVFVCHDVLLSPQQQV
jgi:hypothetical protein